MEVYETESQQVAAIKQFFREYKRSVLFTILLALVVIIGARYWQTYNKRQTYKASDLYQEMLNAQVRNDKPLVEEKGKLLLGGYKSTAYPQLAALLLAKNAVDANKLEEAEAHLKWVIALRKAKRVSLFIAKERLARVLLARGDFDGGLKVLNSEKDKDLGPYLTIFEEARGDLLLAKGEKQQAKAAYFKGLTHLPAGAQAQPLQIKLMDLGVTDDELPTTPGEPNA